MKKKLLIVDPQNDFCDPTDGSLYVKGAEIAIRNLCSWIEQNNPEEIYITLDSHYPIHISSPNSWSREDGEKPNLFTTIYPKKDGWKTYVNENPPEEVQIWPEHCVLGTKGHNLYPALSDTLRTWQIENKRIWIPIYKGQNCSVEEYGAFSLPMIQQMVQIDFKNSDLYVAGVAGDYCVKECLEQLKKLNIQGCNITSLTNCIAWINEGSK